MIHEVFIVLRGKDVLLHVNFEEGNPSYDAKLSESVISFYNSTPFNFELMLVDDKWIVFESSNNITVVVIGDKNDEVPILRRHARWILGAFLSRFGPSFEKWTGDIMEFERFKSLVRRLVTSPKLILKLVFVGSPGVGKTTLMKLLIGEEPPREYEPSTRPRLARLGQYLDLGGFYEIAVWDLPGQVSYRKLWDEYLKDSDIVLLVTDSTEEDLKDLVRLLNYIKEKVKGREVPAKIILIANKQDLPGALKPEEISKRLGMEAHGFVAIDKSYRPKLVNLVLSAAEEVANEIFERTERRVEEAKEVTEVMEALRSFRRDLVKYVPINDPVFSRIDYWMRYLQSRGKLSKEDMEKLVNEMKSWGQIVSRYLKLGKGA